jgi:hypothetical protein
MSQRYPIPPVFLQKRLQAAENKGSECEKERQEKSRGGKLLRGWSLHERQRDLPGERDAAARTRLLECERRDGAGTLLADLAQRLPHPLLFVK